MTFRISNWCVIPFVDLTIFKKESPQYFDFILYISEYPYKKEDYFLCPKSMPHKGYLNWRSLDYFLIRDFFSVN